LVGRAELGLKKSATKMATIHQALPCFVELVTRNEPLTEVEIASSSPLTVHRLARAREEFLCNPERVFDSRNIAKKIVWDIWSVGKKMMV
jgi:hypothetical protein